jgi:hypothetical protein
MAFCTRHKLTSTANPTLSLVQPGVQSDYFIMTKFLGEISIEKCVAFCPYRIEVGSQEPIRYYLHAHCSIFRLSEMSIEESLDAIPITLIFDGFYVYHLFSNC